MITQTMVKPSSWIETGIKITPVRNLYLFKFNENIQARLDELSLKKNNNNLTEAEELELAGILELNEIFTLLNAKIIAESNVE